MEKTESLLQTNKYSSEDNMSWKSFETCLAIVQEARQQCYQLLNSSSVDPMAKRYLMVLMRRLRAANRVAYLEARSAKQETLRQRQIIDQQYFQLQNLYYEQQHLLAAIKACEAFPTSLDSLSLIPEKDFLTLHPDLNSAMDPHTLMLARLSYEKQERERLEKVRRDLLKQKAELISQNKIHKEELEALDSQLKNFIRSAEPLREFLQKY
ncbi:unnamed protein product [Pneumocystis jirovecii]|uniref:Fms interacting protein n=2 Tax=Pneumocystis jirovecii TaxID=42068 RepID=L0PB88_PNEJI|nr:uncharacterized protein T551_00826 [Pneumocystis jirovecii RU7]KTW32144.1 hypothetical protein T551_00826 [Pneumocystis jirovecii RU7]CCJ29472.1 unnamed protein product [Pneumocystis jirovecii]